MPKTTKVYYKVVRQSLESCRTTRDWWIRYQKDYSFVKDCIIQYKVGTYVEPIIPNTRLFIFTSREAAMRFRFEDELIFECNAIGITENVIKCIDIRNVKQTWKHKQKYKHKCYGQALAKKVKLLKQVYPL